MHPGVGLVTDPQAVLGEQGGGVGVVGRDGRLEAVLGLLVDRAPTSEVERRRRDEVGADRVASSAAALVVNVRPRISSGSDWPVRDQPDHARRHDRGLAGAGPGDDDGRLEGGGDGGQLLVAEGEVGAIT